MSNIDFKSEQEQVRLLCSLAQKALEAGETENVPQFITYVEQYTEKFSDWEAHLLKSSPLASDSGLASVERDMLRQQVEALNVVHQKVCKLAAEHHDSLGGELGALHTRSKNIKKYVAPSSIPITLTGKRKG